MQGQGIEDRVRGQAVGYQLTTVLIYDPWPEMLWFQPELWCTNVMHMILNDKSTAKQKWSLPFMWYAEASAHPLLNRRMKDRHKANISDREHP